MTDKDLPKVKRKGTFKSAPLPEVANHPPYKYVRKVHPSVRHIRAYVSTLGASVSRLSFLPIPERHLKPA